MDRLRSSQVRGSCGPSRGAMKGAIEIIKYRIYTRITFEIGKDEECLQKKMS